MISKSIKISVALFSASVMWSCFSKKDTSIDLPVETVVEAVEYISGIDIPWGMAFLPNEDMLITEIKGKMYRHDGNQLLEISGMPEVWIHGQGGLLDVAVHPNFEQNNWIYFTFSSSHKEGELGEGGTTELVRAELNGTEVQNLTSLYKGKHNSEKPFHFGSRIVFDDKGYLYFTIGDRGNRDVNPQDIQRDGGKVYRLKDDGSIPEDNPFVNEEGARDAIFSYGHRNLQGLIYHPVYKTIWEHEHGPKGGDELNELKKGVNYGWPVITYGINYSGTSITDETEKQGMEQPLYYWVPSIAPSGMAYVDSDIYPDWKGNILIGSLSFQYLERLVMKDKKMAKREKLLEEIGRVRDVEQGPDGYIYVSVEGKGILKLVPKA
tara:strand:+ start:8488 stop:9624 length:1137 start_codon:yes stop_codon:yes gene_type:complete